MGQKINKIEYFLYARKSSESDDRQIQSIDDQVHRLKRLAADFNLSIKKIYTEAKSAKKPNNRPLFNEMMKGIEDGEANGILCWQINRLSRNPIDSGKLGWFLQQNVLQSIRTIDREYLPDDNVLLFSVESGSANQFILDLSKNTKRGIQSKLEKGWLPGLAPIGYLNANGDSPIVKDPERFNLVRKMWDLMLTGNYNPPKILEIASREWGLTTRKTKRHGGKELSRSGIYKMFTSQFYAGVIEMKGCLYQGKHEPMITTEEYDRAQILLGRKGKPRPQKHKFPFTSMIKCKECGCFYTAETKTKIIKSTKEVKQYTYYHCTKKSKIIKCSQTKNIREEDLESQIEKELEKYTILPEFLQWALEILNEKNDTEIKDRAQIYDIQHKTIVKTQKELDELTRMRYRQLIDDEAFLRERSALQIKIEELKSKLRETETRAQTWLELTEKTFKFATYARKAFLTGGLETKKEILSCLGKDPVIKDGKLVIEPNEWFAPIINNYPAIEKEYLRLEPDKMLGNQSKTEALASVRTLWGGQGDSNSR